MRASWSISFAVMAIAVVAAGRAAGQSLSTVPSADIPAGERLFDYRAGFSLPDDERPGRFGQRLHYQHSLDDSWRLRLILLQGENADGVLKSQNLIAHVHHQFIESEAAGGWDSSIRFDGFVPLDRRPGRARIVILNAVELDSVWQVRGDVFIAREFGEEALGGLQLETRAEVSYALSSKTRIGAQAFDNWNRIGEFGSFDSQRHQIGFFARTRVTRQVGLEAGWLIGVSQSAPDADMRLIATYAF